MEMQLILIVDSNVENLTKLHHYMRSHGSCIRTAANFDETVQALREFHFDVVVTRQLFQGGVALDILQYLYEVASNKAEILMLDDRQQEDDAVAKQRPGCNELDTTTEIIYSCWSIFRK